MTIIDFKEVYDALMLLTAQMQEARRTINVRTGLDIDAESEDGLPEYLDESLFDMEMELECLRAAVVLEALEDEQLKWPDSI